MRQPVCRDRGHWRVDSRQESNEPPGYLTEGSGDIRESLLILPVFSDHVSFRRRGAFRNAYLPPDRHECPALAQPIVEQEFTDSTRTERVSRVESRLTKRERGSLVIPQHLRKRTITFDRRRVFVVSEGMLRVVRSALPLRAGWRGSIGVRKGESRMFAFGPAGFRNARVVGIGTVQLFGGRVEAWRVELESGGEPERWFVSRETGETLLTQGP